MHTFLTRLQFVLICFSNYIDTNFILSGKNAKVIRSVPIPKSHNLVLEMIDLSLLQHGTVRIDQVVHKVHSTEHGMISFFPYKLDRK